MSKTVYERNPIFYHGTNKQNWYKIKKEQKFTPQVGHTTRQQLEYDSETSDFLSKMFKSKSIAPRQISKEKWDKKLKIYIDKLKEKIMKKYKTEPELLREEFDKLVNLEKKLKTSPVFCFTESIKEAKRYTLISKNPIIIKFQFKKNELEESDLQLDETGMEKGWQVFKPIYFKQLKTIETVKFNEENK